MSDFYKRLQGTANKLLTKFDQGGIALVSPGTPTGPAWNPTPGTPVSRPIKGTLRGVSAQYIDGSIVLATDLQCTAPAFEDNHEPSLSDTLSNGAQVLQVVKVERVPAAGLVVAWRLFVRS